MLWRWSTQGVQWIRRRKSSLQFFYLPASMHIACAGSSRRHCEPARDVGFYDIPPVSIAGSICHLPNRPQLRVHVKPRLLLTHFVNYRDDGTLETHQPCDFILRREPNSTAHVRCRSERKRTSADCHIGCSRWFSVPWQAGQVDGERWRWVAADKRVAMKPLAGHWVVL